MCNSKAEGGRRCQIHLPVSKALISYLSREQELHRSATESLLKDLREEYKVTSHNRDTLLHDAQDELSVISSMATPEELADFTASLETKLSSLDDASLYAIAHMSDRAFSAANILEDTIQVISTNANIDQNDLYEEFLQIVKTVNSKPQSERFDEYNEKTFISYQNAGYPTDRGTIVALERIKHKNPSSVVSMVTINSSHIQEVGYNAAQEVLTVQYNGVTKPTMYRNVGSQMMENFDGSAESAVELVRSIRSNPSKHEYSSAQEAIKGERCDLCGRFIGMSAHECAAQKEEWRLLEKAHKIHSLIRLGKIIGNDANGEEKTKISAMIASTQIGLPPQDIVLRKIRTNHSFEFEPEIRFEDGNQVEGIITYAVDDYGFPEQSTQRLRCSCGKFMNENGCEHVLITQHAYSAYVDNIADDNGPVNISTIDAGSVSASVIHESWDTEEEFLALLDDPENDILLGELETDEGYAVFPGGTFTNEQGWKEIREEWVNENKDYYDEVKQYQKIRAELWDGNVEEGYTNNPTLIIDQVLSIQDKTSKGEPILTPLIENVTDGICDPNIPGSRRFGIELEFSFPQNYTEDLKSQKMELIRRDLADAGLTSQEKIGKYHEAQENGWQEWSLEEDSSVAGELVTPVLADTAEDWAKVQVALEILKRHGARADINTGSHVNISTGSYMGDVSKHTELVRTLKQHEDIIYRSAANPARGVHRQTEYCPPNIMPPHVIVGESDPSLSNGGALADNFDRMSALNITQSNLSRGARAEFRLWDGSLDLATIQMQVATSAAIVDKAEREINENGVSKPRNAPEEMLVGGRVQADDNKVVTENEAIKVAHFVDSLFRKQEDRQRFIALFGANEWVTNYG